MSNKQYEYVDSNMSYDSNLDDLVSSTSGVSSDPVWAEHTNGSYRWSQGSDHGVLTGTREKMEADLAGSCIDLSFLM